MLAPSVYNRFFVDNDFVNDFFNLYSVRKHFNMPALMKTDITETEDGYDLSIEIPGFEKEDIKAELKKGNLLISASHEEKKEEKDEKSGKVIRSERHSGSVSRMFYVGEDIKTEDIKAEYKNGILEIHIRKKEPEKIEAKTIDIA